MQKFEDLHVIERLDETHAGSTQIYLGRHGKQLVVCKVSPVAFRPSRRAR